MAFGITPRIGGLEVPSTCTVVLVEDPVSDFFYSEMAQLNQRLSETAKGTFSYIGTLAKSETGASKKAAEIFQNTVGKISAKQIMINLIDSADPFLAKSLNDLVRSSGLSLKALKMLSKDEMYELARYTQLKGFDELAASFLKAADTPSPFVVVHVNPESSLESRPEDFLDIMFDEKKLNEGDYHQTYRYIDLVSTEGVVNLIAKAESLGHEGIALVLREELELRNK